MFISRKVQAVVFVIALVSFAISCVAYYYGLRDLQYYSCCVLGVCGVVYLAICLCVFIKKRKADESDN